MKYRNIIYKFTALSMLTMCAGSIYAQGPKSSKKAATQVEFRLVDEAGKPISNAEIVIGEGVSFAESGRDGRVSVKMNSSNVITVHQPGYEILTFKVADIEDGKIELKSTLAFDSYADAVNLPYQFTTKRASTGDYIVISGDDLRRYPTLDLRNALAALVPGLIVTENHGATGDFINYTSDKVSLSTRSGAPMFFIDDTPVDANDISVDAEDVESVTVIKDLVGKATFGPRGANGIIYIKTKRGRANDRVLSVNVESGIQNIDRMAGVASGADYARINNMARDNSGMTPLYSEDDITAFEKNNPNDFANPSTNYMDKMFTNMKRYDKYSVSSSGGNDFAQYYANLGYTGEGDNFAIGEPANYRNITFRSNVDMKLNDIVSVNVGVFGGLKLRNSPRFIGSENNPLEFVTALASARSVSPVAFPTYLPIESAVGNPVYGVSNTFGTNPIGNLEGGGYHQERGRSGSVNAAVNFDLDAITEGLSARSYINFSTYNQTRVGKKNTIDSRIPTITEVDSQIDTTYTNKTNYLVSPSESKFSDYYHQMITGYQQFAYDRQFGDHGVSASAVWYLSKFTRKGIENPLPEQNFNFGASYNYKGRYYVDLVLSYAGSMALSGENKYKGFPSIGLGWIVSDESFMDNVDFVDFLKVRGQAGTLGYTTSNPLVRQYENQWLAGAGVTFGPYANTDCSWLGANGESLKSGSTYYGKWKNENLGWEERKEFSLGIDANMFDDRLAVTVNYYNSLREGTWRRPSNLFPLMSGLLANPNLNYETTRYYGAEVYARFSDRVGDFSYSVGASATFNRSKRITFDEPNYRDSEKYLSRIGKSASVIYGYVYEGTYATDEEAQKVVQYHDDELLAGDFKYADVNNDGVLDAKDQVVIGDSAPKAYCTLNVALGYKNFELNVVGDAKIGADLMTNGNSYYAGGWGDNNYSQGVVNSINAGTHPRVTYTKVNNNFFASEHWLVNRDYFKIQNVELAYNIKSSGLQNIGIRKIRVFLRGANLLTVSGLKDLDPESLSSGISMYPLNKIYTGGFNITF